MKKDLAIIGGLFLFVVVLLIFGRGFTTAQLIAPSPKPATGSATGVARQTNEVDVLVKDFRVTATVADTADERKKGLSEMDELPIDAGMLFVFDKAGSYAIWMKGMHFPIDIIWIDESKRIVDIAENAVPEKGKKDEALKIYRSRGDAKYILEINAGLSKLHNLQIGDSVNFGL